MFRDVYMYSQLPISRTSKGPGKVSELARCPTYPRLRISCKYDMKCAVRVKWLPKYGIMQQLAT